MTTYKPYVLLGPGDTIREELEYYGWTQEDLAEITGLSAKHISQLVSNKAPITFDTACLLSKVFKQSPQFWLNADARYRLALEESASHEQAAARTLIYRYMPVRDMRKKGMLPENPEELVPAVCEFWGMKELNFSFMEERVAACFRKSRSRQQFNPHFAVTWLQLGRNASARPPQVIASYDPDRLRQLADSLAGLTRDADGIPAFVHSLAQAGVVFMHIPHLDKTYTDGATFWHGGRPALVYTCRYDRNDNFWFTVAHELGHILLHRDGDSPVFIDSLDDLDGEDQREKEADEFAKRKLHIPGILRFFQGVSRVSQVRVRECARVMGVHPAIVVGALQHAGRLRYLALNGLKKPVRSVIRQLTTAG
jgi:HTH-type transcriptional regulator / antitoxin HigA